jgi:hypothetical protein
MPSAKSAAEQHTSWHLHLLPGAIPSWMSWLYWLSPLSWAMRAVSRPLLAYLLASATPPH